MLVLLGSFLAVKTRDDLSDAFSKVLPDVCRKKPGLSTQLLIGWGFLGKQGNRIKLKINRFLILLVMLFLLLFLLLLLLLLLPFNLPKWEK